MNNPTLNWTTQENSSTNWPYPVHYKTTAALEFPVPPTEFITTDNYFLRQRLLDKLQEESAEVIQAVSKCRRFGDANQHPDRSTTNLEELVQELEDWLAIVKALEHIGYFDLVKSQTHIQKKTQALICS